MAKKKIEDKLDELDLKEIKEELSTYIKGRVDKEIEKSTKKLIMYKNNIILKRDITIIILLVVCALLVYNLYNISDIKIDISTNKNNNNVVKNTVKKIDNKNDYSEYNYLFDNINISENSSYVKNFYSDKIDEKVKLYLIINCLDDEKIHNEDGSVYIDKNDLMELYNRVYTDEFNPSSFLYNKLKFNYLDSKEIFIADGEFKKCKSNVVREIISVNESDDVLEVITVEAVYKNNKLYNVKTGDIINDYKDSLSEVQKELTKLKYTFKNIDGDYKLEEIKLEK